MVSNMFVRDSEAKTELEKERERQEEYLLDGLSEINLAGNGDNSIEVTKAVKNAKINTGAGAGTFKAGSVESLTLAMGGAGSNKDQTVQINGAVNKLSYTGSSGNDALRTLAGVNNSSIDLGAGDNSFTAQNANGTGQTVSNTNITASGDGSTSLTLGKYVYSSLGNSIELGGGARVTAAYIIADLNVVMKFISYPGRKSTIASAGDIVFAV